jgi:predicted lipoprotein with Yx(FWY)xxD motif
MRIVLMTLISVLGMVASAADLVGAVANSRGETLLADTYSRVLYVFDPDQGSGSAKCAADCAEIWPPYLLNADEAKALAAPLGTVVRANKKIQLTYNGRPVYTFAFDRTLGDDRGDGLGGVWHVVPVR